MQSIQPLYRLCHKFFEQKKFFFKSIYRENKGGQFQIFWTITTCIDGVLSFVKELELSDVMNATPCHFCDPSTILLGSKLANPMYTTSTEYLKFVLKKNVFFEVNG